jgi:hypothetical protein
LITDVTVQKAPRVFISYAWEDDAYKYWIERLAAALERDGINVRYDKYCGLSQPLPSFMNSELRQADRVLVVGSPQYRIKVHNTEDQRTITGVGWESMLLTSQLFQGHHQKVIVAVGRGVRTEALPDHLVTLPTFNLADPDDRRDYDRLVANLREVQPDGGSAEHGNTTSSNTLPLWERQTQFRFACTLHDYIHSRWPDKGSSAIYPSWREFAEHFVTIPQGIEDRVQALDSNHATLFIGATGTGKSVTAAAIAYRWSRLSGRLAFWLDCNEFQSASDSDFRSDVTAILEAAGANLLVLDNAHNAPSFARWVLMQFQKYEFPGHRLLILSRPLSVHTAATEASFDSMNEGCTVSFESTPELLESVADRLTNRAGLAHPAWEAHQFKRWHQDFGGDVVAFASALIQTKNGEPKASSVTCYLRSTYVDRLRRLGGLPALTRLASASMIELALNDASLGEQGIVAAEALLGDGLLRTTDSVGYRCWEFGHAGLARLIANILAMDKGVNLERLYSDGLADAVHDSPRLLGQVLARLYSRSDALPILEGFLDRLQNDNSVISSFMIDQPIAALAARRNFPDLFHWEQAFSDKNTQAAILASLVKFPLHEIASFMSKIRKELRLAENLWLDALLATDGFYDSLETYPPDGVAEFLKLCDESKPVLTLELTERLLASERFKQVSRQAYPHHVGRLAIFIEKKKPGAAHTYLSEVVRSEAFFCKITQTQPDAVTTFLKLAEKYVSNDANRILKKLVEDEQFFSLLIEAPPNLTAVFLKFTVERDPVNGGRLVQLILRNPVFASLLASSRSEELEQFLAFADKHERGLTAELVRSLLHRPEFADSREHFPSFLTPVAAQIAFRAAPSLALSLVDAMLSNEEFHQLLRSSKPVDIKRALLALEKLGQERIRVATALLVHSREFKVGLSQSDPEQIAALLKLVSSYEAEAAAQLTTELLGTESFIIRSASSQPLHVASIVRFASRTSTEALANFIAEWWKQFSAKHVSPDGKVMAGCGPMLRVANEFIPSVAEEMVDWLRSQSDHFITEIEDVPREIKQGLVNSLAECGKVLSSPQMRALKKAI